MSCLLERELRLEGVNMNKKIDISKVVVPIEFMQTVPAAHKIDKVKEYYKSNGKLDKPIMLSKNNVLVDGYIRYIVAKENGLSEIEYIVQSPKNKSDNQSDNRRMVITLIVGKFSDNDKEYIWRLPFKKDMNVEIGDMAIVNVKVKGLKKRALVNVVNVFQSDNYKMMKHRLVVKVFKQKN